jgi:hypothetical protein
MTLKIKKKGRPTTAEVLARRASAAEVLQEIDQKRMWRRFLDSDDEKVSLDAWKYLNDRVHGKPKQAVENTGPDGGPIEIVKRVVTDL